ncbi:MAG: acyltransferase, partial [Oligoflexia bacterium]|nr:acyltransferase [Oligoflexia bacterium]
MTKSVKAIVNFVTLGWRELREPAKGRVPALDGLRSLAILLVIGIHALMTFHTVGGAESALTRFPLLKGGWIGVDLFFVLSGFLIGKQLWSELRRRGTIHVGRFLLKRGLRIWPLYFAVIGAAWALGLPPRGASEAAWPELAFLSNYFGEHFVPGSWSLATEEQFYLAFPVLLWVASRFTRDARVIRGGLVALLALAPLSRALTVWQATGPLSLSWELRNLYAPFHTHFDGLAAGLLLSHLLTGPLDRQRVARLAPWLLGAALIVADGLRQLEPRVFKYTGLALVFGGLTWHALVRERGVIARALGWRPFQWVSKLSFGMYLVHRLLLDAAEPLLRGWVSRLPAEAGLVATVLVAALGSAALAAVGYVLVEQPFLRLRGRWLDAARAKEFAPRL